MKRPLIAYIATLIGFLAVDSVWLFTMADLLYRPALGDMLAPEFRPVPALIFYLIFVGGLTFLAVLPGVRLQRLGHAAGHAAVMGFVAYATYDLTNQATLKIWPTYLTIADLIWGTVLSALSASIGYALTRKFAD